VNTMIGQNVLRSAARSVAMRQGAAVTTRRGLASSAGKPSQMPNRTVAIGAAAAGVAAMLLLGSATGTSRGNEEKRAELLIDIKPEENVVSKMVPKDESAPMPEEPLQAGDEPVKPKSGDDENVSELKKRLEAIEGEFARLNASTVNQAFVFVKPHAVTDKVLGLVSEGLAKAGIKITAEGSLTHDEIDRKSLIDNHYGAIASKATQLKPEEQNVNEKGQKQFQEMFGEDWKKAIEEGKVMNAKDACDKLKITGAELDEKWSTLTRGKDLLKFGGGHYVGKVGDTYVINGFFMSMRDKYCREPAQIHYYVVEWDPTRLNWEDFRGKVLGGTDPVEAADNSLRRVIYDKWKDLGLSAQPDVGDNGVHASASPFEALAERVNWTGANVKEDTFGKAVLSLGISEETLKAWLADAQVKVDGKAQSIFDFLEDQNSKDNLEALKKVTAENN